MRDDPHGTTGTRDGDWARAVFTDEGVLSEIGPGAAQAAGLLIAELDAARARIAELDAARELREDHRQWGIRWPDGRVHPIVGTRERADLIAAREHPGGEVVFRVVGPWLPINR